MRDMQKAMSGWVGWVKQTIWERNTKGVGEGGVGQTCCESGYPKGSGKFRR